MSRKIPSRRRHNKPQSKFFRLSGFQPLEDRSLLATDVTFSGGVLAATETVVGESNNLQISYQANDPLSLLDDQIVFNETGAAGLTFSGGLAGITLDSATQFRVLASAVSGINLNLGGGNDTVTFAGTAVTAAALNVDLGSGTNTVTANTDVTASVGNLQIANANVNLAQSVDLAATLGNVVVTGSVALQGAVGTTNTIAGGQVSLGAVTGVPSLDIVARGEGTAAADVNLAGVDIDGDLKINVDSTNLAANSLTVGALDAASIEVKGTTNDTLTFNGALTADTGDITINGASAATFAADVTAAASVTIQNVADVYLGMNVDLSATAGAVAAASGVTNIHLTGSAGTNSVTAATNVALGAVVDGVTGPATFAVTSGNSISISSVDIVGALDLNLDSSTDGTEQLSVGAISAATIAIDGAGLNDTINFNGTVTSTVGSILLNDSAALNFAADVNAATALTISNATSVNLGINVDLSANSGDLSISSGVGSINLTASSGANVISASGNVALAGISDGGVPSPASLTISAGGNITLSTVSHSGTVNINVDTGADAAQSLSASAITAGTLNVSGNGTNDSIALNGAVTTTAGSITITGAGTLTFGADVTSALDLIIQNVTTVRIPQDVDIIAAGNVDISTNVSNILLLGASGSNSIVASGNISLAPVNDDIAPDPATFEVRSGGNITIAGIDISGALVLMLDALGLDGAQTLNAGLMAAGSVTINGRGTNDTLNLNGAVTASTGSVNISAGATANVSADLTAATSLSVSNVANVNLGTNVDVTASGGNVGISTGVTSLNLTGAAGTNTVTASGSVTLGAITDGGAPGPVELEINAGDSATLSTVSITGLLDVNVDASGADGTDSLTLGATSAGSITIDGSSGLNETLNLNGALTATGSIAINNAATANLAADVQAATGLTISNVAAVNLAQDVDLRATAGDVTVATGVTSINLNGAAGTNIVTASGNVNLGAVVDGGPPSPIALQVNSGGNLTLTSANLGGLLDLNVDTDANSTATLTVGTVTAGSVTIDGTTNDTLTLNGTITTTGGSLSVNSAATANVNADLSSSTSLSVTNVGNVNLAANADLNAATNIDVHTGDTTITLTGPAGTNVVTAGGNVDLAAVADGAGAVNLTVNGGNNVTLQSADIAGVLTVKVDSDANAAATLTAGNLAAASIDIDGTVNDALNFTGTVTSTVGTIDVNSFAGATFSGDVSAATNLSVSNFTSVSLGQDVDVAATGNVTIGGGVGIGEIRLTGATGTNSITAGGVLTLTTVTDQGAPGPTTVNLTADSLVLSNVTLVGHLNVTAGSSPSGVNLNVSGALNAAGGVTINGLTGTANPVINLGTNTSVVVRVSGTDLVVLNSSGTVLFQQMAATVTSLTVNGTSANNTLVLDYSGGSFFLPGNITFSAGTGTDVIRVQGGIGADLVVVNNANIVANNTVINSTGVERVETTLGLGNDEVRVYSSNYALVVTDLGGNDKLDFTFLDKALNLNLKLDAGQTQTLGKQSIKLNGEFETIIGTRLNDTITTSDYNVTVQALDGNDKLVAGTASVWFEGGTGNDSLTGSAQADILLGGDGNDKIVAGSGNDYVVGGIGNDSIDGGAGADFIYGGDGNDSIVGGSGNDILLGEEGNDRLYGGNDLDLLIGGNGADALRAEAGDDILVGGRTTLDFSQAALQAVLASWAGAAANVDARAAAIAASFGAATQINDGIRDDLYGGGNSDLFLMFSGDASLDFSASADRKLLL